MPASQREHNENIGAFAFFAADPYLTLVHEDEIFHEGQAYPAPDMTARPLTFDLVKPVKDAGQRFPGDTYPGIGNQDPDTGKVLPGRVDMQGMVSRSEFEFLRVTDQCYGDEAFLSECISGHFQSGY